MNAVIAINIITGIIMAFVALFWGFLAFSAIRERDFFIMGTALILSGIFAIGAIGTIAAGIMYFNEALCSC